MKTREIGILVLACATLASVVFGSSSDLQPESAIDKQGNMSEGFRLWAHLENSSVKVHEAVLIRLSIKNVSKSVLYLVETSPEKEYELDVRNSRGESVRLTEAGQRLLKNKGVNFRVIGVKVKPGEEHQDTVDIRKLRDMSVPGTYYIKATRKVKKLKSNDWTEVVSNTLEVRVVE